MNQSPVFEVQHIPLGRPKVTILILLDVWQVPTKITYLNLFGRFPISLACSALLLQSLADSPEPVRLIPVEPARTKLSLLAV